MTAANPSAAARCCAVVTPTRRASVVAALERVIARVAASIFLAGFRS